MGTTNTLDLNNRINELEEKINDDNTISQGIINSGLSLGFTISWFKHRNVVNIRVENDTTRIPNGTSKIGNIPAGLRPFISMNANVINPWDNKVSIEIRSDGDIYANCPVPTGSSSPYYVQACLTYLVPTI